MAKSQIPVVGESFKPYVNGQIAARQKMYGSGFNRTRTAQEMSYLNSNTTWVKMASSVDISKLYDGKQRLKNLGLGGDYAKADHLAKQAVLFNGLTPLSGNMRAGVAQSNTLINSSAYGFGGTEFGLKSLPGITSIDITPVNRGSIKQATVNIKAYNKFQFELIETLYLRLGFTIMLEWGNSIYVDNNNNVIKSNTTLIDNFFFKGNGTHLEVLNRIEKERSDKFGNYDALFARVVNFDWTFQPNGSYDISIKLTSLGDVIESFKVNALAPKTVIDESQLSKKSASEGGDLTDDNVNKNSISNFLYIIKSQYTNEDFRNKKNGLLKIDSSLGSSDSSPIEQRLYIRLGTLLEYIQKEILTFFTNGVGGGCFPLVYINTSSDCVMRAKPKLISVEPQTCIIKPNFTLMGIEYPEWAENMTSFFADSTGNGNVGFIHDVYLNFNFIEKLLQSNTDKEGNISLYSFITAILGGINKSLSNVCDLEITVNADQNQVIIRDQKLTPRLTKDGMLAEGKKSTIIEVMGFKGGEDNDSENISYTSNFVKNFSFKTQITSKLSSMLSIGATANNNSLNEDATAFSKWNMGLIDRFQQKITDGTPDGCKVEECVEEEDQIVTLVIEKPLSWFERLNEWEKLRQQNLVKEQERSDNIAKNYNNTLENYFNASFADEYKHLRRVYREVFSDKDKLDIKTYDGKKYFQNDPDFVEKGKSILKNYITSDDIDTSVKSKKPSSNIGFIPIELSLDIIGMSGIKIYNQLRLNTDFLPYNYDETMEFVVMGLGHKVDSSGWTTTISAIGKPKSDSRPLRSSALGPLQKDVERTKIGFLDTVN
jgi:hypothetical protein